MTSTRSIRASDVVTCPWTLTARAFNASNGTTFICANQSLVKMGQMLGFSKRKNLGFQLAPPEFREMPFQGIH